MKKLLNNRLNLLLLKELCSGRGVNVNLSYLSKKLGRHRNTIRHRVEELFSQRILDRPICPFLGLYEEYPLLAVVRADLPSEKKIHDWIVSDKHIFAAFKFKSEEHNTILFQFHKDIHHYMIWRESLIEENRIPSRATRRPSFPLFFTTRMMLKYSPNAAIKLIEERFDEKGELEINEFALDETSIQILGTLIRGEGIGVNESYLSKTLGVHRKTVFRRIYQLIDNRVILSPVCRFPNFFVPPNYLLVYALVSIRDYARILNELKNDPHISIALKISLGRYNMLLFENHLTVEDHIRWEEYYDKRFPDIFELANITYLAPKMAIIIDQQKVSMGIIEDKLSQLEKANRRHKY
ncbi:MAG: hypothetical protein ACFE7S_05065 [Candidatus Hodarchaeota archaeon]